MKQQSRYRGSLTASIISDVLSEGEEVKVKSLQQREPYPCDTERMRRWITNRKPEGTAGKVINRIIIADNFADPLVLHEDNTEAIYRDCELEATHISCDVVDNLKEFLTADTIYPYEDLHQTTQEITKKLQENFNLSQIARLLAEYEHTRRRCKQLTTIYPFLERVLAFKDPIPRLTPKK
jgi:hypothetical protein